MSTSGKPLKLLFATDVSMKEVIGGAERVLYEQCTRLAKRGHEVHVLTRRLPCHHAVSETLDGVCEWRYDVDRSNGFSFLSSTLRKGRQLFETLQNKIPFDVVNFQQPFSTYALIRSRASRSIPKVYTCFSFAFEEYRSRNRVPAGPVGRVTYLLNLQMRKRMERKALAASDGIVVLSRFTAEKLQEVYGIPMEQSRIIPGGADLEKFSPARNEEARAAIRRRLGYPENRFILLTVRNLVPRMGLDQLLDAMQEVVRNRPEVLLIIGGSGPLQTELASLVDAWGLSNHVRFAGFIPEEGLADFYRMADLFVLPTVELEGFGLITPEALACGLPVVGTPVGATREILGRFGRDFLFRDATAPSMAEKIIQMVGTFQGNPGLKEQAALRCRDFAERHYNWDQNIAAMEGVYDDLRG
jgi:glycosyltransferase involved in cell wall biosynthesis